MFKKAIVLKVFNTNENYNIASIKKIINELDLKNYESIPDFNNTDELLTIFENILPKSVLCLTLDSSEERKVLLCNPMSSSHIQTPIKVGELIWYFKDTTFSDSEINNLGFLSINHYWHSRVSSNIENENSTVTPISHQELSLFSKNSQIDINFDRLLDINRQNDIVLTQTKTHFNDSFLLQDGNENVISLNRQDDFSKINIISGFNYNIDDLLSTKLDNFASAISINEYSTLNDLININETNDLTFLTFDKTQKLITDDNKHMLKSYEKDILTKLRQSNNVENITNVVKNSNIDNLKPNVTIKSKDIHIVSSEYRTPEIDALIDERNRSGVDMPEIDSYESSQLDHDGRIEIIRTGSENFNSKIIIDEMNDITIDGETIYIGNFIRNLANKNVIDNELLNKVDFNPATFIDELTDFTVIDDMCGKGDGVILGYEKSLSEPLVLGNTLITMLKDMIDLTNTVIDQNKSLIKEIKSMSDEYVNHTHPPVPTQIGPQTVKASLNVASHSGFGSKADNFDKKLTETKDRLNNINQNLKYALSRFSKTS